MRPGLDDTRRPVILRLVGGVPIGLATFTITMMARFRVSLLPEIGADLSMSISQLGLFTAFVGLGRLVADVPVGRLADRLRPKHLMAAGASLIAAGSLLLSAAQHSSSALGAAFLLGVGAAVTNTTGQVFFSTQAPVAYRGAAMSQFAGMMMAGSALGPALGGGLASISSWRVAELVAGLALLGVGVFVLGSRGLDRPRRGDGPDRSHQPTPPAIIPLRVRMALSAVPLALFGAVGVTTQTLIPVIGSRDLGLSTGQIGLALGVGGVVRVLGTIVGGQVSDRVSRKAAMVPAMLIGAAGVTVLAVGSGFAAWLAAIVLMGAAVPAVSASATMIADLSTPGRVGKNLGTFRFVGDIGLIGIPILSARLFEDVGPEAALLPLALLLALVGLAVAVIVPDTPVHPRRPEPITPSEG
jgi:MFS family permease